MFVNNYFIFRYTRIKIDYALEKHLNFRNWDAAALISSLLPMRKINFRIIVKNLRVDN